MELIDWTSHYIDYMNSFKKNLIEKEILDETIECEYKDGKKVIYLIKKKLGKEIIENVKEEQVFVCLNSKENLNILIFLWKELIKYQKLKIMFVNPRLNLQWTLLPYIHARFTDPDSLNTGLNSLFKSVPEVK